MERHLEAETIDPHIIQQISMQISSLAKLGRECEETANPANSLLCQVANIIPPNSHYRFCWHHLLNTQLQKYTHKCPTTFPVSTHDHILSIFY